MRLHYKLLIIKCSYIYFSFKILFKRYSFLNLIKSCIHARINFFFWEMFYYIFLIFRRSRSRSTSPIRSRIRDGADNRDHRARFRNRSPTPLRSRSRSRSIERKKIDRFERIEIDRTDRIEGSPGGGTPTQDSNHGDVDMRLSTTSQSIQSVVAVASSISNNQTSSFPQQAKRRCRDFDGVYHHK